MVVIYVRKEENMSIRERIQKVSERFAQHDHWEDKYKELINFGKDLAELPDSDCSEKFKVKGCQSQVWLKPDYSGGVITFKANSDAVLVKGIVALIVEVYSGSTPKEVVETPPNFLKDLGITEHLSMNRTNGLASMIKQVQMYGLVYKSLSDRGVMNADSL